MRKAIKYFIVNAVALYLISLAVSGLFFENGLKTMVLAGIALSITSLIIKPIINILLLPINLITFGLFRWVGYSVALYIVTLIVPGFKILDLVFAGYTNYWFTIPAFSLHGILALVVFSFIISTVSSLLDWLLK